MASKKTKAVIKIRAFPYYNDEEDPVTGRTVRVERIAVRGEEVELSEADLARAQKFDAIVKESDVSITDVEVPDEIDPETDSVEVLSAWIRQDKPTVEQVVDAANGHKESAQKLLEAENHATGGQPRTTLVADLTEIIEAGD